MLKIDLYVSKRKDNNNNISLITIDLSGKAKVRFQNKILINFSLILQVKFSRFLTYVKTYLLVSQLY